MDFPRASAVLIPVSQSRQIIDIILLYTINYSVSIVYAGDAGEPSAHGVRGESSSPPAASGVKPNHNRYGQMETYRTSNGLSAPCLEVQQLTDRPRTHEQANARTTRASISQGFPKCGCKQVKGGIFVTAGTNTFPSSNSRGRNECATASAREIAAKIMLSLPPNLHLPVRNRLWTLYRMDFGCTVVVLEHREVRECSNSLTDTSVEVGHCLRHPFLLLSNSRTLSMNLSKLTEASEC